MCLISPHILQQLIHNKILNVQISLDLKFNGYIIYFLSLSRKMSKDSQTHKDAEYSHRIKHEEKHFPQPSRNHLNNNLLSDIPKVK